MTAQQAWDPTLYDRKHAFVADLARDLVDRLAAQPGETVLDLGCGTGRMTEWLLESGANVIAVDRSETMIDAARARCPGADVRVADARELGDMECDAILSNATLHWVPEAARVSAEVFRVLRPGGRLVVEFGGAGNLGRVLRGLRFALAARGVDFDIGSRWYFPTIGAYTSLLEQHGLVVLEARQYARPTQLEGGSTGLGNWLEMFAEPVLQLADSARADVIAAVEDYCREQLWHDGSWWADYVRLRVFAERPTDS